MKEEEKINDLRRSILIDKYKTFLTKELDYNADIAKHIITITMAIVGAISVALFKVNISGVPMIFYILYTLFIFVTYVSCLLLLHATRKIIGIDSSILYCDFGLLVLSSDKIKKLDSQHKSWINVEIHTRHCMFISFAIFLFLTFGFIFLLLHNNKVNNNSNSDMSEPKIISRNITEKEYALPNNSDINRELFKTPVKPSAPVQVQSDSTSSNNNAQNTPPITNTNTTTQQ